MIPIRLIQVHYHQRRTIAAGIVKLKLEIPVINNFPGNGNRDSVHHNRHIPHGAYKLGRPVPVQTGVKGITVIDLFSVFIHHEIEIRQLQGGCPNRITHHQYPK